MPPDFRKGDRVEVMKHVNGINTLTYFSATVLASPSDCKGKVLIEHSCSIRYPDTGKPLRETVAFSCLRPVPPEQVAQCFKLGDSVDVFCDDGWQKGTVKDLLGNSKYIVGFDGKCLGIVAEHCNLRLHREWDGASWIPPFIQSKTPDKEEKPKEERVKKKSRKKESALESLFKTGTVVEVRSDEEGYAGAWFDATVVGTIGNDKYWIEYKNLLTDDGNSFVREMVTNKNIRPCPPVVLSEVNFQQFECVDAWFNDGWWEGVVSEVLIESKYVVYFSISNETMEFAHSLLRHHHEWVDGEWKKKEKTVKLEDIKSNTSEFFRIGTKVEVRSDEIGFQGAWFCATIVGVTESGKFVVQYDNLLAEDGTDHLKEEAKASDVRPIPPRLQHVHPFELFEMVDAWYNDGWWVGYIDTVYRNSKYKVYFKNSEKLEFGHCELRPHQEYIDGNWVIAPMAGSSDS